MEALLAAVHGSQLRGAWPLDLAKDAAVWLSISPRLEANTTLDSYIHTYVAVRRDCSVPVCAFPGWGF